MTNFLLLHSTANFKSHCWKEKRGLTRDKDVMVTEPLGCFNHILFTPDKRGIMKSYDW